MTWTYTWDVNNRLVAAVQSAGGSDLYEISYKYDVFGNRIEQTEDTDGDGGKASNITTRFAWEGSTVLQDAWGNRQQPINTENWNIWADLSSGNALQTRYIRGDEIDQLFARIKSNGDVAWYLTDRMGSVRQMLDATGSLENTITYDGFGNVIAETDAAFGDRWKWTGREYNDYTGLQYNRARYYSGESGRWVSEDPIGFGAGDYNMNRYAINSATSFIDPSGHEIRVYPSKVSTGGVIGNHATIVIIANDGSMYALDGGGERTVGNDPTRPGRPVPTFVPITELPKGDYWEVVGISNDGDQDLENMVNAYYELDQLPYKRLGPNSNTYANQVLLLGGYVVVGKPYAGHWVDVDKPFYIPPGIVVPGSDFPGWNSGDYGGSIYDQVGKPKK